MLSGLSNIIVGYIFICILLQIACNYFEIEIHINKWYYLVCII